MRLAAVGYLFRRAFGYEFTSSLAGFGPQIHHPIGLGNEIEVVLDHQHRMPGVHQTLQHLDQASDIAGMKPNGGLFQEE